MNDAMPMIFTREVVKRSLQSMHSLVESRISNCMHLNLQSGTIDFLRSLLQPHRCNTARRSAFAIAIWLQPKQHRLPKHPSSAQAKHPPMRGGFQLVATFTFID